MVKNTKEVPASYFSIGETSQQERGREENRRGKAYQGKSKEAMVSFEERLQRVEVAMQGVEERLEGEDNQYEGLEEEASELSAAIKGRLMEMETKLNDELAEVRNLFQTELECIMATYERQINSLKQQLESMSDDITLCKRACANGGSSFGEAIRVDVPCPKSYAGHIVDMKWITSYVAWSSISKQCGFATKPIRYKLLLFI